MLERLFIKDYAAIEKPSVRAAYGKLAGFVAILCNLLLSTGKLIAGFLAGSVAITADGVNNMSDAASGIISLVGFKLSEKHADAEHPYGHARYEYLAGFLVAVLILVIGAELLESSVIKIIRPEKTEFGPFTAIVLSVSIAAKLWLMLFDKRVGERIDSDTLRAAAADSRNDIISTSVVFISGIIMHFTGIQLDGVMGAAVAIFIIVGGIGMVRDTISPLIGKAPSAETVESIRRRVLSYEGVLGAHDLTVHDYGAGRVFAGVHVEIAADTSFTDCHEIIDKIERDFVADGINLLVHPDPIERDGEVGEITCELSAAAAAIDARITVHDVRLVRTAEGARVFFDCVLPPDAGLDKAALEERLSSAINQTRPDIKLNIIIDSGFAPSFDS